MFSDVRTKPGGATDAYQRRSDEAVNIAAERVQTKATPAVGVLLAVLAGILAPALFMQFEQASRILGMCRCPLLR